MLDDELRPWLPDVGAILVSGPPMTGKFDLMIDLVATAADGAIVTSTKHRGERVVEDLRGADLQPDVPVGVVDCVGASIDGPDETAAGDIRRLDGPDNLTSIGVAFTDLADTLPGDGADRVVVGFHSLAQLVVANDLESVYQFLQVVTGRLRTAGWLGVAVVDKPIGTGEDAAVLEHHFDCVIETDRGDVDRQYRARNRQGATAWVPY